MIKIFRVHPGLDAFEINGVYIPYLDIISNDENTAYEEAKKIITNLDTMDSLNSVNYIEQLN